MKEEELKQREFWERREEKIGKKTQIKQNKGRKTQELQKGNKERNKKGKNTVVKKEEKSMKARKEEETRKGMRRLAATDDPRPMSVSLRPLNKQTINER